MSEMSNCTVIRSQTSQNHRFQPSNITVQAQCPHIAIPRRIYLSPTPQAIQFHKWTFSVSQIALDDETLPARIYCLDFFHRAFTRFPLPHTQPPGPAVLPYETFNMVPGQWSPTRWLDFHADIGEWQHVMFPYDGLEGCFADAPYRPTSDLLIRLSTGGDANQHGEGAIYGGPHNKLVFTSRKSIPYGSFWRFAFEFAFVGDPQSFLSQQDIAVPRANVDSVPRDSSLFGDSVQIWVTHNGFESAASFHYTFVKTFHGTAAGDDVTALLFCVAGVEHIRDTVVSNRLFQSLYRVKLAPIPEQTYL
ncbi:uncharacterized protein UV8b_03021 [Ustilaginoidea virens]|uniref:Uncharacterized protein n=1 Tax=Ustilaginoidea virens TaxID=1159556 RepID=A0A063BWD3_USTVR|nr:uncharacterized protein UV8b_03021 [Ustilaginoidea virens]QUC18780.1 hypothetical protein UV8b_03021 [Ustilaginoidea virens]GAO15496.1 hypothetical protein UVI_02020900 [Ustilaginoidea virens]